MRESFRAARPDIRFQRVPHAVAYPRAAPGELRATWIGHATVLLQMAGVNLLFDPIWSRRASPVQWAGPERHAPPGVPFGELPPVDVVLVSHDHYDHLDRRTIEALARGSLRTPGSFARVLAAGRPAAAGRSAAGRAAAPVFVTPTGYRDWLRARGAQATVELGWWESATVAGRHATVTAVPVRHWTRRTPFGRDRRLWAGFLIEADGFRVFFCGDSGWFDGLRALGERIRPLDLVVLPIGAYEPRWFMRAHHMNPEEAVLAYLALGACGICMAVHWGTFVLTDEPLDEPPGRMRRAWRKAGLPGRDLWIPRHGETRTLVREGGGPQAGTGSLDALPDGADVEPEPRPRPGGRGSAAASEAPGARPGGPDLSDRAEGET